MPKWVQLCEMSIYFHLTGISPYLRDTRHLLRAGETFINEASGDVSLWSGMTWPIECGIYVINGIAAGIYSSMLCIYDILCSAHMIIFILAYRFTYFTAGKAF